VQELVSRGHSISVLTGYPNYPGGIIFKDFRENPKMFSQFSGSTVWRVPLLARKKGGLNLILNYLSFMMGASIWGPFKLRGQKFDVIFVYEPSPVTVGIPAIVLSKFKHIPVVFWVLDLWPETLSAIGVLHSKKLLRMVGWLVRGIYKRCNLILGQSKGFIGNIAKYCDDTNKIRYFPNWAEEVYSNSEAVELATEVPLVDGLFNVLFAGNIGEAQDFPAIIDAVELLKSNVNIRWLIVGDGRMSDWLKQEVAKRRLQDVVLLLGRFPFESMPSFYAHADALLVSLKADPVFALTIPGKVQSYLMSGIPLVGMLDGEGANLIRESKAGLACSAGDSKGLAQLVIKLSNMTKIERMAMGKCGLNYAKQEFDRTKLVDQLESFFDEVASLKG